MPPKRTRGQHPPQRAEAPLGGFEREVLRDSQPTTGGGREPTQHDPHDDDDREQAQGSTNDRHGRGFDSAAVGVRSVMRFRLVRVRR